MLRELDAFAMFCCPGRVKCMPQGERQSKLIDMEEIEEHTPLSPKSIHFFLISYNSFQDIFAHFKKNI